MKAIESNHLLYRNQHNDLFKCINTERVSKRMITYRNQNLFAPPEWYLEHSAKCIKCTTFLQTCIWRTIDLANRKSAALLLSLDFSGTVEISLHFKSREWSFLTTSVNRGGKKKKSGDFYLFMIICYEAPEPGNENSLLIWGFKPHSPLHYLTILGTGSGSVEQKRMQKSCSQERKQVVAWLF